MSVPAQLHPFARPAADASSFVTIVRGEGAAVFDADGRRYVDALASLWYCQIGHGRREVVDAVAAQMRELEAFHCFDMFTNEPADELCRRLVALAPMPDARVLLTSSGSEAVDTAIKLVRRTWDLRGRPDRHLVLSRHLAYHGTTYGGMSAQGLVANREGFGPLLTGVEQVPHDDLDAVAAVFDARGEEIAAVIAEPVIGAAGVYPPTPGYLEGLRELCDRWGALLVLDEVICGFGRLGVPFASQRFGVVPDLVTFAKGATSGYLPLGGVIVGAAVRATLEADDELVLRTGFTYSGHPTASRAALANLDVIDGDGLMARADAIGDRLGPALAALRDDGLLAAVRGIAGIWGVDVPAGTDAVAVRDRMLTRGVIVRPIGPSTVAICPPLVIDDDDLDAVVDALAVAVTGERAR